MFLYYFVCLSATTVATRRKHQTGQVIYRWNPWRICGCKTKPDFWISTSNSYSEWHKFTRRSGFWTLPHYNLISKINQYIFNFFKLFRDFLGNGVPGSSHKYFNTNAIFHFFIPLERGKMAAPFIRVTFSQRYVTLLLIMHWTLIKVRKRRNAWYSCAC